MKILLALGGFAIFSVLILVFQLSRKKARNRYRDAKIEKTEPTLGKNPLDETIDDDTDEVLGLKIAECELPAKNNHSPQDEKKPEREVFISLYLMAPKHSLYGGYELLQALLSAGLRFGEHRIFHRHTQKDGRGDVLFHCASAVAPGFFDLSKMGGFTSPGLCLFFSVNHAKDALETFDVLLSTLDQLVEDLGGDVLDETRQPFNKEKMVQLRQMIRSVETNKTTMDMFAEV